jgi:hypothetical protein
MYVPAALPSAIVTQHCTISSACITSKGAKSAPTGSGTSSPGRQRIARIAHRNLPSSHPQCRPTALPTTQSPARQH